ncbi:MAG TPA: hypothetical protein VK981_11220 [Ramlibacter sp.]|nr:hypothetical protein [Ramlibacter sp.]
MTSRYWPVWWGAAGFFTVLLACLIAREVRGPRHVPAQLAQPPAISVQLNSVATAVPVPAPVAAAPEAVIVAATVPAQDLHYGQLRSRVRWVQTRFAGGEFITPDYDSRLALVKSAARRARLDEVGLSHHDVYGIIMAETSWVPRTGRSKDGTPNLGVAQFEPATARALGLRNPNDMVEAVHVAAVHMKEAAQWSADRIAGLHMGSAERAMRLREGVSIYYNLSSRGRAAWNGRNTALLPIETRRHIINARMGAQEAALLEGQVQAMKYNADRPLVLTRVASRGA